MRLSRRKAGQIGRQVGRRYVDLAGNRVDAVVEGAELGREAWKRGRRTTVRNPELDGTPPELELA